MSPEVSPTDPDQTCTDDSSHISVSKLNGNTISTPRKLATVRKIDGWTLFSKNLVLYTIEGWTVLLKKSKGFRVGEFVLFVEVDSFMPATDPATKEIFAEAGDPVVFDGENGYRARTQTFAYGERGPRVLSQGHIFKLEDFPKIQSDIRRIQNEAGNDTQSFLKRVRQIDYSSLLGIRKFENGNKGPGGALGKIPYFIPKTDMERVQNCPNLFIKPKYREMVYQESMKMDGTSMTVYFVANSSKYFANLNRLPLKGGSRPAYAKGRFGVCSKNLDLNNVQKNHYWDTALREDLHTKLSTFGQSIAVQGELVGWNIQGNRHQCPKGTYHFYVFSIWDIELQKRWPPTAVETWARAQGLKHVPVLGYVTIPKIARDHQDLLTRANLKLGEGMVFKSCADGRWFKVLSNRYILK
ncbi:RNA ligase-domain-containing protein, partial [Diplogelasinospora grovesii]